MMTNGVIGRRTPRLFPESPDRLLIVAAVCTSVCLFFAGLWASFLISRIGDGGTAASAQQLVAIMPLGLTLAVAGMLVLAQQPRCPGGWILLAYALALIVPASVSSTVWVHDADADVRAGILVFLAVGYCVSAPLAYLLPLWFPDGRLPGLVWRVYAAAVFVWVVPQALQHVGVLPLAFGRPNPLYGGTWGEITRQTHEWLGPAQDFVAMPLFAVSCFMLLWRVRNTPARRRRGAVVLLAAFTIWAAALLTLYYRQTDGWVYAGIRCATSLLWPAALAYVVVRDGEWRISRSARRVFAGLLLVTVLMLLYVGLGAVLTLGVSPDYTLGAVMLVTLAVLLGVALRPIAAWAMRFVDRLYFGDRAHPYELLRTLAERLSHAAGRQDAPATVCATVVEALALPGASLTVHTRAGPREVATAGTPPVAGQRFALVHDGSPIGELSVSPRAGETELDAVDEAILRSLADQAAPALAALRLREDLQASREQIVTAREEERRRLRRDIHDGLGPALAGLRLRIDSAAALLPEDEPVTTGLTAVSADLALVIKDVRRITDDLGPAAVGEFGLYGALRHLAANFTSAGLTVTTTFEPEPPPSLTAAVEVAVYRIAGEALNNVVRHARARHATVRLEVAESTVALIVTDDGIGPTPIRNTGSASGVGLQSMADRAAELGGTCTRTGTSAGTRVHAILPRTPNVEARR